MEEDLDDSAHCPEGAGQEEEEWGDQLRCMVGRSLHLVEWLGRLVEEVADRVGDRLRLRGEVSVVCE